MTSSVDVVAESNDVLVTLQDRHPEEGWQDSYSQIVPYGNAYTFFVWNDRRITIEELPCRTTTC